MAATREFDDLASKEAGEIHKCFAERRLQVSLSQNLTLSCTEDVTEFLGTSLFAFLISFFHSYLSIEEYSNLQPVDFARY